MKGWLIYDPAGAQQNRRFIDFWISAAHERGVTIQLLLTDAPFPAEKPDFAVVRTMNPMLSRSVESMGVPVFNAACVSEVCNDKWKTYCLAETLGVPYPKTIYVPQPSQLPLHPYPYVLKSCTGHGGTQVYMIANDYERQHAVDALQGIPCVLQEPVSDLGKDLRIYVLGDKILAAMLRTSQTDFRSNFCLGGHAEPYQLGDRELKIVKTFSSALPFGLVGIDLIFHHGKTVFNEIEDVVGCRMLYTHTKLDPVALYLDYILQELSKM